jgi:hypothetical protein
MADDILNLKPIRVVILLNSTPLGTVISEQRLRNHRTQAGLRLGATSSISLIAYINWLMEQRHTRHTAESNTRNLDTGLLESEYAILLDSCLSPTATRLSAKQRHGIIALLVHPTHKAAAEALQVRPNTISRWLRNPEFRNSLECVRRVHTQSAYNRVLSYVPSAIQCIVHIAHHGQRDHDRLRAAQQILQLSEQQSRRVVSMDSTAITPGTSSSTALQMISAEVMNLLYSVLVLPLDANEKVRAVTDLTKYWLESINRQELDTQMSKLEEQFQSIDAGRGKTSCDVE